MSQNQHTLLSEHPFWVAVSDGDVDSARALLEVDASLVHRDFRPADEQDPHTYGFPLVKAADTGNLDMLDLLLRFKADIDAKSPCEDQRELGGPIMHAFERRHYDAVRFLLDRGASVAAYGYCSPSLVDLVYEEALGKGAPQEFARKGFVGYLGTTDFITVEEDAHEAIKLFDQLLDRGGQPSLRAIVQFRYYELAEQLLKSCPNESATIHDHPPGTVFGALCRSAGWQGIPKVVEHAMLCCPDLYDREISIAVLQHAIKSHNRVGLASEYYELVETQLKFLKSRQALESVVKGDDFQPHFLLAEDYLWPGWYGDEREPSSVQTMIALSELFTRYGFTDINRIDPKSKQTALARALSRTDHPGLLEFAEYLATRGGK